MLTGDLIDAAQMLLKYGVQYLAKDFSENMLRGINALRCLVSSAGDNIWNFLASAYWLVATFGYDKEINPYLDQAYQNVCTCQEDAKVIVKLLGAGDKSTEMLQGCSEFARNKNIDAQNKRAMFVEKIKEANMKALKEAAQKKRTEEMATKLDIVIKEGGEEGIEKETIKAFNEYKQKSQTIAKKTTISEKDRVELERAKNEFDAIKKAKRQILTKQRKGKFMEKLKEETGVTMIKEEAEHAMDELDKATRKQEEFPDDEQVNIEVEVAEAKVDSIAEASEEIIDAKEVGVRERGPMKEIIQKAKEKRAYNNMWKDAKTMYFKVEGGKEELQTMMETVEENFKEKEKEYNTAVRKKALKLKEIGRTFDKALCTYNASLTIRFDLDELKEKMKNKLNIEISPEVKAEIKDTVTSLKKNKAQLAKIMKYKYEEFIRRQKQVEKKPDDQKIAKQAAEAEEEYTMYKEKAVEQQKVEEEEAEEQEEFGAPDEDFEETTTETVTKADGTIVTTITITTSTGSTTTTSTVQGPVETTVVATEGTGAIVKEGTTDNAGNEKVTETTKKTEVTLDGTKTETTKTVTDKVLPTAVKPKENADGSKPAAPGQTKDMGLPTPKKEGEIL
jgi:hypothetical protein